MNDAWGYDNDGSQGETELNGPKALRDAYKAQQEMLKEIRQQLADERAERQKAQLSTVFTTLGVPGAVDLYQGEPDPDKAKAWVETMRATFGNGSAQEAPAPVQTPVMTPDQMTQYQQMTEAGSQGVPMGNMEAAMNAVGQAGDLQSLIAAFQNGTRTQ